MKNEYKIRKLLSDLQFAKDELRNFLADHNKNLHVLWDTVEDTEDNLYQQYLSRYKELLIKSDWNYSDPLWEDKILGNFAKEIPDKHRLLLNQWVEKCSRIRFISLELMFFGFKS